MPDVYPGDQKRHDPHRKFNFRVRLISGGSTVVKIWKQNHLLAFSEVSGLDETTESVSYKEGDRTYERKLMGRTTFPDVTMARGMDSDATLARWRRTIKERTAADEEGLRGRIGIDLLDRRKIIVASWELVEAWPMSLTTDDLSNASDVLVQRVTFSVEEIRQTLPTKTLTYAKA